ncbi:MAG: hypothetical protein ACYC9O_17505 [Candidatus Latescibacterota bacterium]
MANIKLFLTTGLGLFAGYRILFFILLLLTLHPPSNSLAQYGSFRIGTDFPLRYTAGYTINPKSLIALQVNAGILAEPYDEIILRTLSSLGMDKDIIDIVENSYDFGMVFDAGGNLRIGKGYIGVYGQMIHLMGASAPYELVGEYLDVDLSPYYQPGLDRAMTLQSTIYQGGVRFGTRFALPGPNLELHAEFSLSANLHSKSQISSETPYPAFIGEQFDENLRETFRKYLYVPTFGLFLVYYLR